MRETLVKYGIGIRVKLDDLLNSTSIDPGIIYNEIIDEELYVEDDINLDESISDAIWNIEKKFDKEDNKNYGKIIEIFKNKLSEKVLSSYIIIFRKNFVDEDIIRMDDDKKIFLFNTEDMKYTDETNIKVLNGKVKIFLELVHSY
jgi:hypothetical protein